MKRTLFLILITAIMIISCKEKTNANSNKEQNEDIKPGPYSFLDLSDDNFTLNMPEFKSEADEKAWKKLAGVYVKEEAPDHIPEEI